MNAEELEKVSVNVRDEFYDQISKLGFYINPRTPISGIKHAGVEIKSGTEKTLMGLPIHASGLVPPGLLICMMGDTVVNTFAVGDNNEWKVDVLRTLFKS